MTVIATLGTPLSVREREVLLAVATHGSNAAVGRAMYLSEQTVKTHVRHAARKLGAPDRTGAIIAALRLGIIQLDGIDSGGPPPCERDHAGPGRVSLGAGEADARCLAQAWVGTAYGDPPPSVLERARETLVRLVAGASR